ncbi:MAG TPA: flagellar biosynthesis anti-sigma factor FlgM [Bryobacteraceae bacterium]|nr:flagellar biosynthesis anti-sigma factor FlgM [Bryobacteraceae bacterium]
MRIPENSLTDQLSSTASRAAESQRIEVHGNGSNGASSSAGADRVDLSGLAGRLSQSMASLSQQSAARVSQLQQSYRAGRYQPSASSIAQAMTRS